MQEILDECREAAEKYGAFASTHEALGVLTEEFFELLEAIRKNNSASIIHEATQVASVCIRLIDQCEKSGTFFAGRSNL